MKLRSFMFEHLRAATSRVGALLFSGRCSEEQPATNIAVTTVNTAHRRVQSSSLVIIPPPHAASAYSPYATNRSTVVTAARCGF
jgi:hypothetical protein